MRKRRRRKNQSQRRPRKNDQVLLQTISQYHIFKAWFKNTRVIIKKITSEDVKKQIRTLGMLEEDRSKSALIGALRTESDSLVRPEILKTLEGIASQA